MLDTCVAFLKNNTKMVSVIIETCKEYCRELQCAPCPELRCPGITCPELQCPSCGFDATSFIAGMKTGIIFMGVITVVLIALVMYCLWRRESDDRKPWLDPPSAHRRRGGGYATYDDRSDVDAQTESED